MDTNSRTEFFFNELEKIVLNPITNQKTKIEALRTYGTLLPTISNDSLTVKHEVSKLDTSSLSNEDKISLLVLLSKIEGENDGINNLNDSSVKK